MIGELVGSYRIVSELGEGGMGVVYLAEHPLIGRKVAIKVLRADLSRHPDFSQRFLNEARTATLVKHSSLVDVFDFGYLPSGNAFLIMEYLEGESLSANLRRSRRLPVEAVVELGRQAASALAVVHAKGIVHRDLKPDNIFLVPDAEHSSAVQLKILDFGIAKLAEENKASVKTRTGAIMGTPAYMSPEQCHGAARVDHRSDIYSLGCILFEMTSGRPPFTGEGFGEVLAAHLYEPAPDLAAFTPGTSRPLADIIQRALSKKADDRFQSMADLAEALGKMALPAASSAVATPARTSPKRDHAAATLVATKSTLTGSVVERQPRATRSGRRWFIPTVFTTIMAIGGGLFFTFGKAPEQAVSSPASSQALPISPSSSAESLSPNRITPSVVSSRPAEAANVRLRIDSQPRGAKVYHEITNAYLGETPLTDEQPRGPGRVGYRLRLTGYQAQRISLPLRKDGEAIVTLSTLIRKNPSPKRAEKETIDPFSAP